MNSSPLPPVWSHELSLQAVTHLFEDILTHGTVEEIRYKSADTQRSAELAGQSLPAAAALLLTGELPQLQVRYVFDGSTWLDTIRAVGSDPDDGFKVVRIRRD